MFVLGVDPGLSRCGYGCVEQRGRSQRAVAAGVIATPPGVPVAERLAELQREFRALLIELRPSEVAIERVFFQNNVRTATSVSQASGVLMAEAINFGCSVAEYSPNEVKEAVAGWGAASKAQVEQMVQTLLGIDRPLRPVDASDAVAIALCHLARGTRVPAAVAAAAQKGSRR
jgi:crossover junction endodeoxyribonuclease RuvC